MAHLARCLCGPRVRPQRLFAADAGASGLGRADPTGTMPIQRRWSRDLDQRWGSIKKMLPHAIEDRMSPVNHIMHSALTGKSDPVVAFQGWLDEAMRQVVLGINGSWLLPYVRQATDAGALHARTSTTRVRDAFNPDQPRGPDGQWTASGESIVVYHGTTSDVAADILKNGIKASQPGSYSDKDLYHDDRGRSVYVARTESIAEYYAKERVHNKGGTAVLFELRIPKEHWADFKNDMLSSYGTSLGAAHSTKSIPPEWIVGHREIIPETTQPKSGGSMGMRRRRRTSDAVDDYETAYVVVTAAPALQPPADRTHLLQSLAITELQGIIEAVSQRVVRAFAAGYLAKKSPSAIAIDCRRVVDEVGMRRGQLLVSFMVVRSFNAAALDGFRARGVTRVGTVPELAPRPPVIGDAKPKKKGKLSGKLSGMVNVLTAEDDRVCPECQDISAEGPYDIDEADSLIPAHPRCRCALIPAEEPFDNVWADAFNPDEPRDQTGKWTEGGRLDVEEKDYGLDVTGPDAKKYKSLVYYQADGYKAINNGLRNGTLSPKAKQAVKDIDSVMATSRTKKAMTVWRGVDANKKLTPEMFKPGKTITLKGYTSTSADKYVAEGFRMKDDAIQFKIDVPKGARALEIKSSERELLLPRDSKFRVKGSEGVTKDTIKAAVKKLDETYKGLKSVAVYEGYIVGPKKGMEAEYKKRRKAWEAASKEHDKLFTSDKKFTVHLELIK